MALDMCQHGENLIDQENEFYKPIDAGIRRPKMWEGTDIKKSIKNFLKDVPFHAPFQFIEGEKISSHFFGFEHKYAWYVWNHAYIKVDSTKR